MQVVWLCFCAVGFGFLYLLLKYWFKMSKLPPGPRGLPLFGNIFQMDAENPHHTWSSWAGKYRDVYTVNTLGMPLILCNSFEAIYEMLVSKSQDFAGRPRLYAFKYITGEGRDIVAPDISPEWVHRKKLFMTSIKMYGDGKQRLENIMTEIIDDLVEDIERSQQQSFDIKKPLELALANTLSLLSLGNKFEHHDPDFHWLMDNLDMIRVITAPSLFSFILDVFPWLHYLPLPYCRLMDGLLRSFGKGWLPKQVEKRKAQEDYDPDHPGCVVDAFIKQHEDDMRINAANAIDKITVDMLLGDIFAAGMLTSTAVLYTMVAVLVARPDIQSQAREEVDKVLGGCRPALKDKEEMPYFQALLEEVLRNAVIISGVGHKAMTNSKICGHNIPNATDVIANIWHLNHDPAFWDDPWTYRPERFLDNDGMFVDVDHPVRQRMLVFGAGRRVCPGQHLARNRIFLIVTSLLQKFVLVPADENQQPKIDPRTFPFASSLMPRSYKIRAIPRE